MSGTGATLFTDSSVRVRRYSVIVGKVSVDVNVAENDGSPVFIGDSSLGSAPGALILFRRPRRDGQDGTMGNGHTARRDWWARSSFFLRKKGDVRCRPSPRPGGAVCGCGGQVWLCRVVLWWECAKSPFLFGTLHPWPTLVWSGGLHPTQIIRWPVLSDLFGRCPDGSPPSVHSGPGTCRCLLRSTSPPSVSPVLSPILANNGCSGLVC